MLQSCIDFFHAFGMAEWAQSAGVSTLVVAAAEIGDKTQLLALCLAARFRKSLPVVTGIFAATVVNHALAAFLGAEISAWLSPDILKTVLTVSFLAMGAWMLVPDKLEDESCGTGTGRYGVFATTFALFFMAEMGDKTQLATVALGAHYGEAFFVTLGTTVGMLIADVPAVFIGDRLSRRLNLRLMRIVAAVIFIGLAAASALAE